MEKLKELLNWCEEELRSTNCARNRYGWYDPELIGKYDGRAEALEEVIEQIKEMMKP